MPASVLVIRPGSLGDLLLTLPVIETLKGNGFEVDLVTGRKSAEFFVQAGFVRSGLPFDGIELLPLFQPGGHTRLSGGLKNYFLGFDLVLCYCGEDGSFAENLKSVIRGPLVFQPLNEESLKMHAADFLLQPLVARNLKAGKGIRTDSRAQRSNIFFIHPGSGSLKKNWKPENFAAVAEFLLKKGVTVKLILGECETRQIEYWNRISGPETVLKDKSLPELFRILNAGRWFLGNDSGVSHLASLSGLETFLIYGPTDPAIWRPAYGKNHIVWHRTGCNPCRREKRSRCDKQQCLEQITPAEVSKTISPVVAPNLEKS